MLLLAKIFLRKDFLEMYPTRWVFVTNVATNLLTLTVYWFTAKAFVPKFEILGIHGSDYFTFIVVGEMALAIPLALLTSNVQEFRYFYMTGTLEPLTASGNPFERTLIMSVLTSGALVLIDVLTTLVLSVTLFELDVIPGNVIWALCLQLASYPLFLTFGMFAGAMFIYFGRGAGVITAAAGLVNLFSGVYFPTSVFPEPVYKILSVFSPYNLLIEQTRQVLVHGWTPKAMEAVLTLMLGGVVFFPVAYYFLSLAVERHRKRGASLFYFG